MSPTSRSDALAAVNAERDYQDQRWDGMDPIPDHEKSQAEWLIYMEHHLELAKEAVYSLDREAVNHEFRKIAALAVAGMEYHGVIARD